MIEFDFDGFKKFVREKVNPSIKEFTQKEQNKILDLIEVINENQLRLALNEINKFHKIDLKLPELKKEFIKKEEKGKEKKKQADVIVDLILENSKLFHDQYQEPFARIKVDDHYEVHALKSKFFRRYVSNLFYESEDTVPSSTTISASMKVLEAKSIFESERYVLYNRVAWNEETLYYDLCNKKWEVVKITKQGWNIVSNPPIIFRRYAHQKPQVIPLKGGDFKKFLDYLNIKQPPIKHLILVAIATFLIPGIPHVIIILHGAQGSAKSTFFKVIRKLFDPSALEVLTFPNDKKELIQKLSHHWFSPLDNVSYLSQEQSDIICRAVTGEGFSKRELYTDDDDIIYAFICCVGLNGINIAATKPDLLDRSILVELERISRKERKTEREFWKEFEKDRPYLLGALFETISTAMRIKEELKELPRMADFAEWGEAISQALDYDPRTFLNVYYDNLGVQNIEAIESHIIGLPILTLMQQQQEWEGTPTELLKELERLAENLKINTNSKVWPKAAHSLTRRLKELKTNLVEEGISYERGRDSQNRTIRIIKSSKKSVNGVKATKPQNSGLRDIKEDDTNDACDTSLPTSIPNCIKKCKSCDIETNGLVNDLCDDCRKEASDESP
ncbi:MAG: hypothetical protein ABIB47_02325 [Candidatus Woesearchaeota archaeon]